MYHDSLSELVRACGSDPHEWFPSEELQKQFGKFGWFGSVRILLQIIVADPDTIVDMDALAENMGSSENDDHNMAKLENGTDLYAEAH